MSIYIPQSLNQRKEDFIDWLRSKPENSSAVAGDPCSCWLAIWFASQGYHIWGVFPEHYLERINDAPGGASQEVLFNDPEAPDFRPGDRVELQEWACEFAKVIDRLYFEPMSPSTVTRDQAIAVLTSLSASYFS